MMRCDGRRRSRRAHGMRRRLRSVVAGRTLWTRAVGTEGSEMRAWVRRLHSTVARAPAAVSLARPEATCQVPTALVAKLGRLALRPSATPSCRSGRQGSPRRIRPKAAEARCKGHAPRNSQQPSCGSTSDHLLSWTARVPAMATHITARTAKTNRSTRTGLPAASRSGMSSARLHGHTELA